MSDDLRERERVVLLPCPFCGKEMSVSKSGMATHLGQSQDACIIGTMGIPTDHPPSVDKWNTRADDARAALAARDKRVREEALREAAAVCENVRLQKANGPMPEGSCFDYEQRILALISEGQTNG